MNTLEKVESVKKQIVVDAPQARVFRVFTNGMDSWWPRQHHVGKSPMTQMLLDPGADGRWYSICEDGTECDVGKVLEWDPPRRLVLAWQLTAEWQFDPNFVTEVEVTFTPVGAGSTRVDLEHRNLARFGMAADKLRKSIDSPDGWGLILSNFAKAAESDAA